MLNKSVFARFPRTYRKYIYHVYMIYTHWPLIKWLLHGLMCCGFRDAIPQPFVVTSGWVFVAFLWSPTCLTSDPWHQQYIFLHISFAHCTIIYLFVCLFSVCGRVIILSRDGWDVVKISVDCFGNLQTSSRLGPTTTTFTTFKVSQVPFLPHCDARCELQQVVFTRSTCLNTLSYFVLRNNWIFDFINW